MVVLYVTFVNMSHRVHWVNCCKRWNLCWRGGVSLVVLVAYTREGLDDAIGMSYNVCGAQATPTQEVLLFPFGILLIMVKYRT